MLISSAIVKYESVVNIFPLRKARLSSELCTVNHMSRDQRRTIFATFQLLSNRKISEKKASSLLPFSADVKPADRPSGRSLCRVQQRATCSVSSQH